MDLNINVINTQVNNNQAATSCLATKKIKIPTNWSYFLLWFIFFIFINHNLFNFANGYALDSNSRPKRVVFPNIAPTDLVNIANNDPETQSKPSTLLSQAENFEVKFPGGGTINAKGIFTMGLLSATAALVFICDHIAKVFLCVIRRLNNSDGNELEIQMQDRRFVFN
jgi:hypothetical protein